jgi:hypothetical protein
MRATTEIAKFATTNAPMIVGLSRLFMAACQGASSSVRARATALAPNFLW